MRHKPNTPQTALLGDLIAGAFDEAAQLSADPTEVSRLATRAVVNLLRRIEGNELEAQQTSRIESTFRPD